jgi:hypothetical protein
MKKCENCNKKHNGSYGSSRFCSKKCARGFSTKEKRLEINRTVSLKLKKIRPPNLCEICGTEIGRKSRRCLQHTVGRSGYSGQGGIVGRKIYSCEICGKSIKKRSKRCKNHRLPPTAATREKLSILAIKRIKRIGSNPIKIEYKSRGTIIRCDSKMEYAGILYLKSLGEKNIKRNHCAIIYYDVNGQKRRYLPDFISDNYITEVKSIVGKSLSLKWHAYKEQIPFKKEALEREAKRIGKKALWLSKENVEFGKIYASVLYGKASILSYSLK